MGVKKNRVSVFVLLRLLEGRKSGPTSGRSPRIGIRLALRLSLRLIVPPTTIVWPLITRRREKRVAVIWFGIRWPSGLTDSPAVFEMKNGMYIVIVPSPLRRGTAVRQVGTTSGAGVKVVSCPPPNPNWMFGRKTQLAD